MPPPWPRWRPQNAERDHLDRTRTEAPLRPAEDGVKVATDGISVEQVVDKLEDLFRQRVSHEAWPAAATERDLTPPLAITSTQAVPLQAAGAFKFKRTGDAAPDTVMGLGIKALVLVRNQPFPTSKRLTR